MHKKNCSLLIIGLSLLFSSSIQSSDTESLKTTLKNLYQKSATSDITEDIIDLNLTEKKYDAVVKILSEEEKQIINTSNFQLKINFTKAYNIISQENPNSAINLKKLYENTLRYNQYINSLPTLDKTQTLLNFIFNKNKENENIDFARTIEIAMLGCYFLRHIAYNIETKIFPFVISSQMLFNALQEQDKANFLESFGTIGTGEQSITINHEHDIPVQDNDEDRIYTYQQRVIDYLEGLRKSEKYNQNLISLTGLYFLKLYFTGAEPLPEYNLGGFMEKRKFLDKSTAESLKETEESKTIKEKAKEWNTEFKNYNAEQKKLKEQKEIEQEKIKKKLQEEAERGAKNRRKLIYGGILGTVGIIAALIYKNWNYLKNWRKK